MGHVRIENHDTLINKMNDVFDTHESQFLSELEIHSEREDEMVLELLRMFFTNITYFAVTLLAQTSPQIYL